MATPDFLPIDTTFLSNSFDWLSDGEFQTLIMSPQPDRALQLKWYEGLRERTDYQIWGVQVAGEWVGAFGLKHIDLSGGSAEYWGYIYPLKLRNTGIGWKMFRHSAEYGRQHGLKRLYLKVAAGNRPAYLAYLRWGFSETERAQANVIQMEMDL